MTNDNRALALTARFLMALIFLVAGARKALTFAATVGYFGKLGLPAPELVVTLTIALELLGALALIAGFHVRIVASVLALFTIAAALLAHQFWNISDPALMNGQLNHFLKNVAMVGGFLMIVLSASPGGARRAG